MIKQLKNMYSNKLSCGECGAEFPIMRNIGSKREHGHIKHMWCYKCKKETGFIENVSEKEWSFYI